KDLLVSARVLRNAEMGFNLVLGRMARGMKASLANKIQEDTKLTSEQKIEAQQKALVYLNSHIKRLKQLSLEKIDMKKLVFDVYVPLYDKYFDQKDIQAMIDWNKSPTAQKALDVMPQVTDEAMKSINAVVIPKMKDISAQMEAEDKAGKI